MQTINDVMNFLNQMELFNIINGLEYRNFIVIRNLNDKSKKYIPRGHRNTRYHERILSNKKKSLNLTYFYQFSRRL